MTSCPDFSQQRILVVGDVMLDQYWHGDTSRISPEAPVPVVNIAHEEARAGGAANVALNVHALGAQTTLMGLIGQDEAGEQLSALIQADGVKTQLAVSQTVQTVVKLRIIGRNQQLIRLDFEDPKADVDDAFMAQFMLALEETDLLILSDYAKGVLTDPQKFIQAAKLKGIPVVVDPKHIDLSVYQGASILTPNLKEFERAMGPVAHHSDLTEKGMQLIENLGLEALLVTQGSQGMTLLERNATPLHIAAKAKEVFDITGAGDTVIAAIGAVLAKEKSFAKAAKFANIAAGLSVARLGTAAITKDDMNIALGEQPNVKSKIVHDQKQLKQILETRKANGDTIVMTNGCFDILHAGHISYLQEARALGDCLVMAVNTDLSVKRLKGDSRPINNTENRMAVLASLACIDYLIPFGEDTPEALISDLLPNILVKGGDYRPEQVAGGQAVKAQGGKVIILPFVDGLSTTATLEKLSFANQEEEFNA